MLEAEYSPCLWVKVSLMSCEARVMSNNLTSLCASLFNAELFRRAAIERCAFFKGITVAFSGRKEREEENREGNKRQTCSWAVPNRCFYQLSVGSGACSLRRTLRQECFAGKWTKLVRLEVSGDNAAEECLPFSINTISTQEMSLRERSTSWVRHYVQTSVSAEMS